MPSVHQTQPAQGQIWLVKTRNPDIYGYFPRGRMEAHSNAPAVLVHNTYLYLQSVEHLYLYTFHLCVAPYLLTPGCVSYLCGKICLLCILAIIIFIFFLAHLVEGRSREIGDKETHWEGYTIKLFKDMLWQFCIYFFDLLSHMFFLKYCTFWFIFDLCFWKHIMRYLWCSTGQVQASL